MPTTRLQFAEIVATPTATAWTQVYHAGNVFVLLSLTKPQEDDTSLPLYGKQLLNALEAEFFALETKTFASIKHAMEQSLGSLERTYLQSLFLAYIGEDGTYLLGQGSGTVILRRKATYARLLTASETLHGVSGHNHPYDLVVIQTDQFATLIPFATIASFANTQSPQEIAETIMPLVHNTKGGSAAALILSFQEQKPLTNTTPPLPPHPARVQPNPPPLREANPLSFLSFLEKFSLPKNISFPQLHVLKRLPTSKKVGIGLAFLLLCLLVLSITKVQQHQTKKQDEKAFLAVYDKAKKQYEEGKVLLPLNKPLAQEELTSAKASLEQTKTTYTSNSQKRKTQDLLTDIDNLLKESLQTNHVSATQVDKRKSPVLAVLLDRKTAQFAIADETDAYFLDNKGVLQMNIKTGSVTSVIQNSGQWKTPGGLGVFLGNIYVLDKNPSQIHKFVKTGSGYSQTAYLHPSLTPDFTNAQAMAIDSSIYVLFEDGTILKYTKGTQDTFGISGLPSPIKKATAIFTNKDTGNIYILDQGNSRIVVLNKTGAYQAQYQADVLASATAIDVAETNKRIFVLAKGKIYELPL